jgi:hypothetical protein
MGALEGHAKVKELAVSEETSIGLLNVAFTVCTLVGTPNALGAGDADVTKGTTLADGGPAFVMEGPPRIGSCPPLPPPQAVSAKPRDSAANAVMLRLAMEDLFIFNL